MTISVPGQLVYSSQGDGVTTEFTYPVRFEAASELVVISREDGVDTVLTLNTDYTVAGAGLDAGGTVTMLYTPTAAEEIVRYRDTAAKQIVNLADSTRNPAEAVENQLDRFAMKAQDQDERLGRAVRVAPGSAPLKDFPGIEAGMPVVGNDDEDGLVFGEETYSGLRGRVDAVEGVNDAQNTRLAAVESKNSTQDARLDTAESKNAEQDERLDNISEITDPYLGASATAPTTRTDGSALVAGDQYFDTTQDKLKVWTGSAWIGGTGDVLSTNNGSDFEDLSAVRANLGTYADKAAVAAATIPATITVVETLSYDATAALGKGGATYREAVDQAEYDGYPDRLKVTSGNGRLFVLSGQTVDFYQAGAVGDRLTDDVEAVRACFDGAAGGRFEVVAPPGDFLCGGQVVVKSNTTYRGHGGTLVRGYAFDSYSTSFLIAESYGQSFYTTDLYFYDLWIEDKDSTMTGTQTMFSQVERLYLIRPRIIRVAQRWAIVVAGKSIVIDHPYVRNLAFFESDAIHVYRGSDVHIINPDVEAYDDALAVHADVRVIDENSQDILNGNDYLTSGVVTVTGGRLYSSHTVSIRYGVQEESSYGGPTSYYGNPYIAHGGLFVSNCDLPSGLNIRDSNIKVNEENPTRAPHGPLKLSNCRIGGLIRVHTENIYGYNTRYSTIEFADCTFDNPVDGRYMDIHAYACEIMKFTNCIVGENTAVEYFNSQFEMTASEKVIIEGMVMKSMAGAQSIFFVAPKVYVRDSVFEAVTTGRTSPEDRCLYVGNDASNVEYLEVVNCRFEDFARWVQTVGTVDEVKYVSNDGKNPTVALVSREVGTFSSGYMELTYGASNPTFAAPNGSIARRTDLGSTFLRKSGAWVEIATA